MVFCSDVMLDVSFLCPFNTMAKGGRQANDSPELSILNAVQSTQLFKKELA